MGKLLKSCFLAVSDRPARFSRGGGGCCVSIEYKTGEANAIQHRTVRKVHVVMS